MHRDRLATVPLSSGKVARLSLFGMGRGSARGPPPGRRSLGGANCRWAQPLSRPQPPEAVAEGQPLQGLGPSTTIGAEFTPASGLAFRPILRAEGKGWREAERVRRGAVGMRFSCGFSTGSRVTMTFGAAKAIMGFGEARIRGELYRGRQNHRATALYSVGLATRTMMHSCASAAKFLGGGTILSLGAKAMARCGSRRLGSLPARAKARSPREKKLLFRKGLGKPRRLSSPGV